jgi:hypothetical protein
LQDIYNDQPKEDMQDPYRCSRYHEKEVYEDCRNQDNNFLHIEFSFENEEEYREYYDSCQGNNIIQKIGEYPEICKFNPVECGKYIQDQQDN